MIGRFLLPVSAILFYNQDDDQEFWIYMKKFNSLANYFLIAMPTMEDPNFFQTVTYICEHNEEGALGVVINRPTVVHLSEILDQMEIEILTDNIQPESLPILYGGPVHQERGFVIHSPMGEWRASFQPSNDVAITTSRDILQAIAEDKGPEDVIVTLGHAGWDAGQLEEEILQNTWLCCEANTSILFHTPFEKRWTAAAALLGINDIYTLSGESGHA